MNNTSTKKITILLSVILIIIIVGATLFYSKLKSNTTELEKVAIEIAEISNLNLKELEDNIIDAERNLEKLNGYFVEQDKIVEFINNVESLALIDGTEFKVVSLDENVEDDNKLKVSIEVKGKWAQIKQFLLRVENISKVIEIKSVILTSSQQGDWSMRLDFDVLLKKEKIENGTE